MFPFLFEHGTWFWKVALVLFALISIGIALVARRVVASIQVRRRLPPLERRTHVVRGTLRGESKGTLIATLATKPNSNVSDSTSHGSQISTWTADRVWIETKDGRVELDAPVEVIAGSDAVQRRKGVPGEIQQEHFEAAKDKATWLHRADKNGMLFVRLATLRSLHEGDLVVAAGVLAPKGEDDKGERLRTATGDTSIPIAAARPMRELAPVSPLLVAIVGVLALGIGYMALDKAGEGWRAECEGDREQRREDKGPFLLTNTHACSLAMAAPGTDRKEVASNALSRSMRATPQSREQQRLTLALTERVNGCDSAVAQLVDWFQNAEAAKLARRCKLPRHEHFALMQDARLEEAAALVIPRDDKHPPYPRVGTLVALGRWADAAKAVDDLAAHYEPDPDDAVEAGRIRTFYTCFADLMRHHAGDATAAARIRQQRDSESGHLCEPVLAQVVSDAEKAEMARTLPTQDHARRHPLERILRAEGHAIAGRFGSPERLLIEPTGSRDGVAYAWLVGVHRDQILASAPRSSELLRWLAVKTTFDGDTATATTLATEAQTLAAAEPEERDFEVRYDIKLLPAAIALYTDATQLGMDKLEPKELLGEDADHFIRERLEERWHDEFAPLQLRDGGRVAHDRYAFYREYGSALDGAADGDGGSLAARLHERSGDRWSPMDVAAVLPRVTRDRDALLKALTVVSQTYAQESDADNDYPIGLLGLAIEMRAMYRLAGLKDQAKHWDEIYKRIDTALSDRKRLVALLIWID